MKTDNRLSAEEDEPPSLRSAIATTVPRTSATVCHSDTVIPISAAKASRPRTNPFPVNPAARAFYNAMGFNETLVVPGYYRGPGGARESAMRMLRMLRTGNAREKHVLLIGLVVAIGIGEDEHFVERGHDNPITEHTHTVR